MANIDHGVILGALGSTHTDGTGAVAPPDGMVIAAIQFISKNTPTALIAEPKALTPGAPPTVSPNNLSRKRWKCVGAKSKRK